MKNFNDEAKNRIFLAAAENGLLSHLGDEMMDSAKKRGEKRVSLEETVRLRAEIASILECEKDERSPS